MSRPELSEYFQWFLEQIPIRVKELSTAVRRTAAFQGWEPDFSPSSLDSLGEWYADHVESRRRTEEEIQEIEDRSLIFFTKIGDAELTNKTFSLAIDIGMYFSQCLLKNCPELRWEQPLTDKKFADYGQPVLIGFGPVPLNPVRIAITLAYALVAKTHGGRRLRDLYDFWSSRVQRH